MSVKQLSVVLVVAVLVSFVNGRGCGEPLSGPEDTCSDDQCSRNVSNFCVRGFDSGSNCSSTSECYIGLSCNDGVCVKELSKTQNMGIGLAAAAAAVLCFGSSFVPIKKFKKFAGDGVFSQFCMCFGRFAVGLVILLTRKNQIFYPDAALGGVLWAIGNSMSVPIIQCLGMGLGVAIWGTTNMLLGWASGAFGLWGVKKEVPENPALSYLGVAFSFVSIILFVFVNPNFQKPAPQSMEEDSEDKQNAVQESEKAQLLYHRNGDPISPPSVTHPPHPTIADIIGKTKARIIGVTLALSAGVCYGMCMDPSQHLMTNYSELSKDTDVKYSPIGLDYVFSFNTGAMGMSFMTLLVYSAARKLGFVWLDNFFNPVEHEKIMLPSFANGFIGSAASAAWFVANQNLGLIVSFPIIGAGPGVISALWGVFVFHEIKGIRNFIILATAFAFVIASSVCSAMGKGG